jgi:outer membrane protein TolC
MQQNSMIDLEIADYERTVQTLYLTIADHGKRIKELLDELQSKEDQCTSLQKLVGLYYTIQLLCLWLLQNCLGCL